MSCGCSDDVCGCSFNSTNSVSVIGSGQSGDPYFASVIPDPVGGLQNGAFGVGILLDPDVCNILTLSGDGLLGKVYIEAGANVSVTGCGTQGDPFIVEASAAGGGELAEVNPGDIWMTASDSPGVGWLMCDGASYDSVADPTLGPLYAEIGTKYGGTGPTDFRVPPSPGRSPMGAGAGVGNGSSGEQGSFPVGAALTARALGDWTGAETHALTEPELATHDHVTPDHDHPIPAHATNNSPVDAGMGTVPGPDPGADYTICTASAGGIGIQNIEASGHNHTIPAGTTDGSGPLTTTTAGDGDAHETTHPVFVVNFKIKI